MNALQRLNRRVAKGLFGVTFGTPGRDTWSDAQDWLKGLFAGKAGQLTQPYAEHGTFSRCIEVIARDAAAVKWEFYPGDVDEPEGEDPLDNHPVLDLWQRPNRYMLGNQLFIGSYLSKLLWGEWIWYYPDLVALRPNAPSGAVRAAFGGEDRIQLLHPGCVKAKNRSDGSLYWVLETASGEAVLDERKLTMSRRYNPYNPLRGLPLAASIAVDMQADHDASLWNGRFFGEQNGIPSGILTPSAGSMLDKDQREEIHRTWNQRHAGTKRSIALLPSGWTFQDLGATQKDMSFLEQRGFTRDQILARTGVPPLIAGYLHTTIRYNAAEQKDCYWNGTIWNFLCEEQSVLNADFLPKIGVEERVWPKWEAVKSMLSDMETKSIIARTFFDMGVPFREINERLELGFDPNKHPSPDTGYLPVGILPADMSGASMVAPGGVDSTSSANLTLSAGSTEERRALVWRSVIGRTRDLEERFDRAVRSHFLDIQREALRRFDQERHHQRKDGSFFLFDLEAAKKKLQKIAEPIYRAVAQRGGDSIAADLGTGISFNVNDPMVRARLAELTGKITRIDETVERALRGAILEGVEASETLDELRDRVRDVMRASMGRSRVIARTETGMAFNMSRDMSMRQAGIRSHEWLSSRDQDVRDSHAEIDGDVEQIGEPFSNGLRFPQDPSGPAEEIINCRCVSVPVVGRE